MPAVPQDVSEPLGHSPAPQDGSSPAEGVPVSELPGEAVQSEGNPKRAHEEAPWLCGGGPQGGTIRTFS